MQSVVEVPFHVVDLSQFLEYAPDSIKVDWLQHCRAIAMGMQKLGAVMVRDPRHDSYDYDMVVDNAEMYFKIKPQERKLRDKLLKDVVKPHLQNQSLGITPEKRDVPRNLDGEADAERYFWKVGPRPTNNSYEELSADSLIPCGIPDWERSMDLLGNTMLATAQTVAEMAAIGFDLSTTEFTDRMNLAPHVLVTTGTDLKNYREEGTVIEAPHYDLNLLTLYGKSRFRGLNIWFRNGDKVEVNIPRGCFLVVPGKQMEWFTGGECLACKHEVVVTKKTTDVIKELYMRKRRLWRVSSAI